MHSNGPSYPDLAGRVVLITGGATGIGASLVEAFVAQGSVVHFADIDEANGTTLAAGLGEHCQFSRVDVTQAEQVQAWVEGVGAAHAVVDVLVNNAAQDKRVKIEDLTPEEWDRLVAVNLRSHFLTCRSALPYVRAGSSIINLGSITFNVGFAGLSAYVASKGGIVGFTRSLARELGPRGVRVNCLEPGWTMTERQLRDYVTDETKEWVKGVQCLPDLLQPEEIAQVALFLASGASSALTGQTILADKGWAHI
jgi:NAD(P)-dependent dehydrogenase (short-subunit alcohol dehydrogenase family)